MKNYIHGILLTELDTIADSLRYAQDSDEQTHWLGRLFDLNRAMQHLEKLVEPEPEPLKYFGKAADREEAVALMCRFLREFYAADFDIDQFHAVIDDAHAEVA